MSSWFCFYILCVQSRLGEQENCNPEKLVAIFKKKGMEEEGREEGKEGGNEFKNP